MEHVIPLWLPILVSAILVFVASSILWMALPLHKKDYRPLPDEDSIAQSVTRQGLVPGVYAFPWCAGKDGAKPSAAEQAAMAEKMKRGPWGMLIVRGPFGFANTLGLWFAYLILVGVFVGYLSHVALGAGAPSLRVFRVAGTAAFLIHAGGLPAKCIWEGKPWSQLPVALFDAVVYTLLTAVSFAWLWPAGDAAAG